MIEMLAAVVLASMMMVAVLGVLRTVRLQSRELTQKYPVNDWKRALSTQLHNDLCTARRIAASKHHLRLIGYGGRDFVQGEATLRPTEIIYEIVFSKNSSWLVRREIHLDSLDARNSQSELAVTNVATLRARRIHRQQDSDLYEEISTELEPAPARVHVEMFSENQSHLVFEESFILHSP